MLTIYGCYHWGRNHDDTRRSWSPIENKLAVWTEVSEGTRLTCNNWVNIYGNEDERAWSWYLKNPFNTKTLQRWWKNAYSKINWSSSDNMIPRKAAWFVSDGCSCQYRYSSTVWNPLRFPDWLIEMTKQVMETIGWPYKFKT